MRAARRDDDRAGPRRRSAGRADRRTSLRLPAVRAATSPTTRTAAGLSPLEAARETDLGAYAELLDAERIVGNLHRAYAELAGADRGAPVDVLAAFADMITFNGGGPLRCLA